jgi:hypothetical protein
VRYFEASLESVASILPESYLLLFSINDSPAAMFDFYIKKIGQFKRTERDNITKLD